MKRVRLLTLACVLAGSLFLLHPQISHQGILRGLSLCASAILPTIFPCLVLSDLLLSSEAIRPGKGFCRMLHLSPAMASSWITGTVAGYPSGARAVCNHYAAGTVTKEQAEHALYICNNTGPAFIIGVVGGGVFHSIGAGIILYGIHLMASILMAQIFPGSEGDYEGSILENPQINVSSFIVAIGSAAETTLSICGYLIFFCIITEHLQSLVPHTWHQSKFYPIILGFLELTSGVHALSGNAIPKTTRWLLSVALLGWGGLCVHGQTIHLLSNCKLSPKNYLIGKCIHCIVSTFLIALLIPWLCPSILNATLWYIPHILLAVGMIIFLAAKSSSGKRAIHPL